MTCLALIRHGETADTGQRLSGRLPGIGLSAAGWSQARSLHQRLHTLSLDLIVSSPLERCQQTAQALGDARGLQTRILPELIELDYGAWTGVAPAQLEGDLYWHEYNRLRSLYRIPNGELLAEGQLRMLRAVEILQRELPEGRIALVGHSDLIKALICQLLAVPLDCINRLTVSPGSVSIVSLGSGDPKVHCINETGELNDEGPWTE